jgi:predicted ArsR family transcriptional regulator
LRAKFSLTNKGRTVKSTVSIYDFRSAFQIVGRENFSYEGLGVLFDYLEAMEDDMGEEIELDVIALCCEYYESSWGDVAREYCIDLTNCEDEDEKIDAVEAYLSENTSLCGRTNSGCFVFSQF